jgi:NAD(P)-dependent dehydrogenase (short-subunit alcohol dehydrogenase family)
VLVTGTSTGIGRSLALRLASSGFHVLAGVRKAADGQSLKSEAANGPKGGHIEPVILDVTESDSISAAATCARQSVGQSGLYALINNAGVVVPGPVEHLELSEWRRQFDVNFFGLISLTQHALPLLRAGVRTHGLHRPRVLLVSSIGGRVAQPVIAAYTASKWATTALGDSLRIELRRQGIGVTVIEPGAIASAIWGKGEVDSSRLGPAHPARVLYGPEIDGMAKAAAKAASNALPAEKAAIQIERALLTARAPAHVLVGRDARIAAFFKRFMPYSLFERILIREFGVAGLAPANNR